MTAKLSAGGCTLTCQGPNFVPLQGASLLLGSDLNIVEVSQNLFLLLNGWAPPSEEALNWLQFSYTTDWTGDYVAPASTIRV